MRWMVAVVALSGCGTGMTGFDRDVVPMADAPLTVADRTCRGLDIPNTLGPYDNCMNNPSDGILRCQSDRVFCSRYRVHQNHPDIASCTIACSADADCPDGGVCTTVMTPTRQPIGLCFRSCANNAPCPARTGCRPTGLNGNTKPVCLPYEICTGTGFVLPDGGG